MAAYRRVNDSSPAGCIIVARPIYVHHLGLYFVSFRRVLIYKIDVALQLTKL